MRPLPAGFHIHYLHGGKASYPEVAAYRAFFESRCTTSEGATDAIPKQVPPEKLILWQMMGFYPRRVPARLAIHDYRSLSVGTWSGLKDLAKRTLNAIPDIRIFQNDAIRRRMVFDDPAATVLLPMGVPGWIFDLHWQAEGARYDFGYVGAVSEERGFGKVLRAFGEAYRGERSLLLIGPAEPAIVAAFGRAPGIAFAGQLTQREALLQLLAARVAICPVPQGPPYDWQTPTKLLEYAALGMPVLANDSPTNLKTLEALNMRALLQDESLFRAAPDPAACPDNRDCDVRHLAFDKIIADSGIVEQIFTRLAA